MSSITDLIAYCQAEGRICPKPPLWNRLFQMLPDVRRQGGGFEPGAPLILAAWWESSNEEKRQRLFAHLQWAAEHGAFESVDQFIRKLAESDWHHAND